jgi:hypothetical protein
LSYQIKIDQTQPVQRPPVIFIRENEKEKKYFGKPKSTDFKNNSGKKDSEYSAIETPK